MAVIAAAVFWTWLWGPIGLLLSTPLTVCAVVLGQHVPQLAFLDVLLGSEPVLSPPQQLYKRLLVGDAIEATEQAEEQLRESSLTDFYDETLIPALALAEQDRVRGSLGEDQLLRVAESALTMVENLAEWEGAAPAEPEADAVVAVAETVEEVAQERRLVLCAGARDELDDAAAAALGQLLEHHGVDVRLLPFRLLQSARLREVDAGNPAVVILSYMNSDSLAHARFLVRRLRRRLPEATIIAGFWGFPAEERSHREPVEATRADQVATSLREAVESAIGKPQPEIAAAPARLALAAGSDR